MRIEDCINAYTDTFKRIVRDQMEGQPSVLLDPEVLDEAVSQLIISRGATKQEKLTEGNPRVCRS
jgi:hypothetical protein